ncbi:hypothetical protein PX554_24365 [Sphingomonas sp. H39-1-10]|uniref:hypothetical protein n=1 Tax=Sphingomonas pollutisoli TaxID=3030829 RepID=UPI0023B8C2F6|nr:hypothetical protein [Sphingomonas pollutisoli]MDF0491259.1 hypothetical protein [Sphingomonas pollutisoli]
MRLKQHLVCQMAYRKLAIRGCSQRKERLVLLRSDAGSLGRNFAKTEKAAEVLAERS